MIETEIPPDSYSVGSFILRYNIPENVKCCVCNHSRISGLIKIFPTVAGSYICEHCDSQIGKRTIKND